MSDGLVPIIIPPGLTCSQVSMVSSRQLLGYIDNLGLPTHGVLVALPSEDG